MNDNKLWTKVETDLIYREIGIIVSSHNIFVNTYISSLKLMKDPLIHFTYFFIDLKTTELYILHPDALNSLRIYGKDFFEYKIDGLDSIFNCWIYEEPEHKVRALIIFEDHGIYEHLKNKSVNNL